MKKNFWKKLLGAGILATGLYLGQAAPVSAEIVEGRAAIINNNVEAAKETAMLDAMRSIAERQVGVFIDSHSETKDFMLVSDRVMSDSQGYVKVNKILASKPMGDIYYVKLDLTADAAKIETAVGDVKAELESRVTANSRIAALIVAVSSKNIPAETAARVNSIVGNQLEEIGFTVNINDSVAMLLNGKNMANPADQALVRRDARNYRESETALVTGFYTVFPQSSPNTATVAAQFNLIGLDSNVANMFAANVTAAGENYNIAVANACEQAARQAAERLGQKALRSLQGETRGGQMRLKPVIYVSNVTSMDQFPVILNILQQSGISVKVPPVMLPDGRLKMVTESTRFANLMDLQMHVTSSSNGVLGMAMTGDAAAMGATAVHLVFKG